MTDALSRWKGSYGIYVSKTRNGLAQEIGDWCEFGCEYGPVVACTAEHLKTALRFAVVETRLRAAANGNHEIDTRTVAAELGRFRDSLNHLTRIKRKVGDIRQILEILPAIETEADQMRNEMQDALGKIEGLLPKWSSSPENRHGQPLPLRRTRKAQTANLLKTGAGQKGLPLDGS